MNKQVEELVEWVAKTMNDIDEESGECYACWDESTEATHNSYRIAARAVLSNPNLALIEICYICKGTGKCTFASTAGFLESYEGDCLHCKGVGKVIIPLAEALERGK